MTRAPFCDKAYWDKWTQYLGGKVVEKREEARTPTGDLTYRPQYAFTIVTNYLELMLMHYSRGDSAEVVTQHLPDLISAWEEAERLHLEIMSSEDYWRKFNWSTNLDHYIVCFWITGLALCSPLGEDGWKRLIALMGNEGKDRLLDTVLASRQQNRVIGTTLCHPKPYQQLLDVVTCDPEQQAHALQRFVSTWYADLDRPPANKKLSSDTALYNRPFWYKYGEHNRQGGAYFGQWCVEAVAVAKLFGIDDSLCVGHPQYPGDLLRPGVVTPPDLQRLPASLKKWPPDTPAEENASGSENDAALKNSTTASRGWLARLFSRNSD
ncbi:hypothetical protein ABIC71_002246 [Herbaspirillum seropedicae]|uniref:PoNi-like cognate immunity protein n=1 Tax=Herbaspirillum seropedicae TaxID=964 RepID=UPI0033955DB5